MPNVHKEAAQYFMGANRKAKVDAIRGVKLESSIRSKKSPPVVKDHPYKDISQKEVYARKNSPHNPLSADSNAR